MLRCSVIIISVFFFLLANAFASTVVSNSNKSPAQANKKSNYFVNQREPTFDNKTSAEIVKFLGWEKDKNSKKLCDENSLCGGRYIDPTNIINIPIPRPLLDIPMDVTANEPAFFTQYGMSKAKGDVTMMQPGREITADQVTFLRDSKTGKLREGFLEGHVNFREYGRLIVAEKSHLDFAKDEHASDNLFYRLQSDTIHGTTNIWGKAKHALRDKLGVLRMKKATVHTCPPDIPSWHLWSNKLVLDRDGGRGEAYNAFLFVRKVPVLYTPYLNFPIDKRRKTGFLFPEIMSSKDRGFGLFLPYYLNLAPNYDATVTPRIFTKRGVLFNGEINYLTKSNSGEVSVDYFPHDKNFAKFRDNTVAAYPPSNARKVLQNSSSQRGFISAHNDLRLNNHWKGLLSINYVTDDYFLQDYKFMSSSNEDQLFNNAELGYANDNWRFSSLVQGFQTLHRLAPDNLTSSVSVAQDQYKKLPQLNLGADFFDGFGGLNYQFDSEFVNFVHRDDFNTGSPLVGGGRFNAGSAISLPLNWYSAYLTPRVQFQATHYSLNNRPNLSDPNNITRVMPLFSIDSGAIFSREIKFFKNEYTHTLEPRLLYVFVPTKNQDDIPIFDTTLLPLDFNLRPNRFGGIDRIGDANQITGALTTRLLDESGVEKLILGCNQTVILNKHLHEVVMFGTTDALTTEYLSPLVGSLTYSIIPKVSVQASTTWDHVDDRFQATNASLSYNDSAKKVINFLYNYTFQGDGNEAAGKPKADLQRLGLSFGWRLWQNWVVLGNANYNVSYKRAQDYIYGIEYDSCCWAIRFVHGKIFVGLNPDKTDKYDSRSYIQFCLKGLGEQRLGARNLIIVSGYNDEHTIGL